jgi:hypothetical protein
MEVILDLDLLEGHHTGENLAQSFLRILDDFQLTRRIMGVKTDNASNCDTLFTLMVSELHSKVSNVYQIIVA